MTFIQPKHQIFALDLQRSSMSPCFYGIIIIRCFKSGVIILLDHDNYLYLMNHALNLLQGGKGLGITLEKNLSIYWLALYLITEANMKSKQIAYGKLYGS